MTWYPARYEPAPEGRADDAVDLDASGLLKHTMERLVAENRELTTERDALRHELDRANANNTATTDALRDTRLLAMQLEDRLNQLTAAVNRYMATYYGPDEMLNMAERDTAHIALLRLVGFRPRVRARSKPEAPKLTLPPRETMLKLTLEHSDRLQRGE